MELFNHVNDVNRPGHHSQARTGTGKERRGYIEYEMTSEMMKYRVSLVGAARFTCECSNQGEGWKNRIIDKYIHWLRKLKRQTFDKFALTSLPVVLDN